MNVSEDSRVVSAEQSNTSIVFDQRFILKLYRRVENGVHPDLEVGNFLTVQRRFAGTPDVRGWLQLERARGEVASLASLNQFVPNEGDAWAYTLDEVERFLEVSAAHSAEPEAAWIPEGGLMENLALAPPTPVLETAGEHLETSQLLGKRIAEMHVALASDDTTPDFAPERYTPMSRRALYQSLRNLTKRSFHTLRQNLDQLPTEIRAEARRVLEHEDELLERVRKVLDKRLSSYRIRIHGDLHLGQVLWTGRDFLIIDFEGEPSLPIGERRLKRSPLRDVAGMLRSYHYASVVALEERIARRFQLSADRDDPFRQWTRVWRAWNGAAFLRGYLETARRAPFLADASDAEIGALLLVHRMEKSIYELLYELNSRPHYVHIPLAGIRQILEETSD